MTKEHPSIFYQLYLDIKKDTSEKRDEFQEICGELGIESQAISLGYREGGISIIKVSRLDITKIEKAILKYDSLKKIVIDKE